MKIILITATFLAPTASAFVPRFGGSRAYALQLDMAAKVGIYFGTSTGSTETVADYLAEAFGADAEGPFDVEIIEGPVKTAFEQYDALVVGTPTWNTGADTERSGTGWDELYYGSMQELNLQGKKVAVFGLGDQESYAENYADATGELHDVFQGLGCQMMGYTSQEGYEHEDSKSIRGDLFCGLLCDEVNQEDLSEERVQNWVAQLKAEGFLEAGGSSSSPAVVAVSTPTVVAEPVVAEPVVAVEAFSQLEEHSELMDKTIETHANTGFKPYYNAKTRSTMWVGADGRSCYYTADAAAKPSVSA
jgi:flavodoxin I